MLRFPPRETYLYALQGAFYGIVICGIKSSRIWFGPLPLKICQFQHWASQIMIWYFLLTLFFIYLAKFMYICVWKHMRDTNDDLIVMISVRTAVFISVWVSTTGFSDKMGGSIDAMCTGIFNDHNQIMDSEISPGKSPAPYSFIFWSLSGLTLSFMASITITRKRNNESMTILKRPKDLESMMLNFALLILILINAIGYNLYWRG